MSSKVPENLSPHRCASSWASMSCAVMRSLLPALRTLPSSTYRTRSSRPMVFVSFSVPLSCIAEVREMTFRD